MWVSFVLDFWFDLDFWSRSVIVFWLGQLIIHVFLTISGIFSMDGVVLPFSVAKDGWLFKPVKLLLGMVVDLFDFITVFFVNFWVC